jgi:hypothetical protein
VKTNESKLNQVMAKKGERLQIPALGEYYSDLLAIDSAINARSEPQQANSLLCSKLQEREEKIKSRVKYLADKRGRSFDEMWNSILIGRFDPLSTDEYRELVELTESRNGGDLTQ